MLNYLLGLLLQAIWPKSLSYQSIPKNNKWPPKITALQLIAQLN